jgi:hypothetical protein
MALIEVVVQVVIVRLEGSRQLVKGLWIEACA